jgi:hypothetical protein
LFSTASDSASWLTISRWARESLRGISTITFTIRSPVALVVEERNAAAAHAQFLAARRAFGNLEGDRAVDAGNLDFGAQSGLGKADGDDAAQVVAVALKKLMRRTESTRRGRPWAAGAAGIAFAGVADAGSVSRRRAAP